MDVRFSEAAAVIRPASGGALLLVALGTGCLPTLMLSFNSELAAHGGALFASWAAHGTGTIAALMMLLVLAGIGWGQRPPQAGRAPLWAYLGGCTGAVNVMLSSTAVNAGLALAGTQAVALSGQMLFGLAADRWGLLGLPRRPLSLSKALPIGLIVCGSMVILLFDTGLR